MKNIELMVGERKVANTTTKTVYKDYSNLDGLNEYISFNTDAILEKGYFDSFSYTFWVRVEDNDYNMLFSKLTAAGASGEHRGIQVQQRPNGSVELLLNGNLGTNLEIGVYTPTGVLKVNEWNHVAISYEGSSFNAAGCTITVNGVKQTLNIFSDDLLGDFDTTADLVLGDTREGANLTPLNGDIQYFAQWDHVLTNADINILYQMGLFEIDYSLVAGLEFFVDTEVLDPVDTIAGLIGTSVNMDASNIKTLEASFDQTIYTYLPLGQLDLDTKLTQTPLNFLIDDIRKPSSTNSNYSKTITLPSSKNNNKLLGMLFDINSEFTYFNALKKTPIKLLVDSSLVMDGILQLTSIGRDNEVDTASNVVYNVVLYENKIDLWTEIGEKYLTDLDLSRYNHTVDYSNIVNSWSNTWEDGYTYPMLLNNNSLLEYGYADWIPAIYHKSYLKQIIEDAGYNPTGSFFDDSNYAKEIIPYNGIQPSLSRDILDRREFAVGFITEPQELIKYYKSWYGQETGFGAQTIGTNAKDYQDILICDNESTGTLFDDYNNYDTIYGNFEVPANGIYNLSLDFDLDILIEANTSLYAYYNNDTLAAGGQAAKTDATPNFVIGASAVRYRSGQTAIRIGTTVISSEFTLKSNPTSSTPAFTNFDNSVTRSATITGDLLKEIELQAGDKIQIQLIMYQSSNKQSYNYVEDFNTKTPVEITYTISTNNTFKENKIFNKAVEGIVSSGDDVIIEDFIPKNFKQKDLILDVMRRYNLYISIDPNNNKNIVLESRDDFYDRGVVLDWSDKKDLSTPDKITLLSELVSKEIDLTYTNDSDSYNKNYTESTTDIYGVKKIIFDTDFRTNKIDIKTPFSPTPLVYGERFKRTILPAIESTNPKSKPRVLYYGGLKDVLKGDVWKFIADGNTYEHTTYPFASHFDDYANPTLDINFGTNIFYYIPFDNITDNNLYNRYWKNYIEQIVEGKMLTAKFKLNEVDINYIKNRLNSKIWINDSYYYINKIKDWTPSSDLTSVELIKVKNFTRHTASVITVETNISDNQLMLATNSINGNTLAQPNASTYSNVNNGTKGQIGTFKQNGSLSSGSYNKNQVLTEDALVIGKGNLISATSEKVMVNGDNNLIDSTANNVAILGGDNNTIAPNVENSFIIGTSDKVITQSNEVWLGDNLHIIDGAIITSYNLIEGGYNILRDPFAKSPENMIECGEDEIRDNFTTSNINLITGGVDSL